MNVGFVCVSFACEGAALSYVGMLGLWVHSDSCLVGGPRWPGWSRLEHEQPLGPHGLWVGGLGRAGPLDPNVPWIPTSPGFTFPEHAGGGAVTCVFKNTLSLHEGTDKLNRFTLEGYGFT